jgi:hypothetical protein
MGGDSVFRKLLMGSVPRYATRYGVYAFEYRGEKATFQNEADVIGE